MKTQQFTITFNKIPHDLKRIKKYLQQIYEEKCDSPNDPNLTEKKTI